MEMGVEINDHGRRDLALVKKSESERVLVCFV